MDLLPFVSLVVVLTVTSSHAQGREAGRPAGSELICRGLQREIQNAEQRPCRHHDVCVAGYRLEPVTDACVDRICERNRSCCRDSWRRRCVAQVAEVCERSCDSCDHRECNLGEVLDRERSDCTRQVCTTDPYCCDTAWDLRCVEEVRTLCDPALGRVSETDPGACRIGIRYGP